MMRLKILIATAFFFLLLFVPIFTAAQVPMNCESNLVTQDAVVDDALKKTRDGRALIAIVRLGDGETSRELMRRRVFNMRESFRNRYSKLTSEQFLIAEGERVKGYGRVEYYVNGKLYEQIMFPKNRYICHSCCGPDERYYPYKASYEHQQKQRQKRKRRN